MWMWSTVSRQSELPWYIIIVLCVSVEAINQQHKPLSVFKLNSDCFSKNSEEVLNIQASIIHHCDAPDFRWDQKTPWISDWCFSHNKGGNSMLMTKLGVQLGLMSHTRRLLTSPLSHNWVTVRPLWNLMQISEHLNSCPIKLAFLNKESFLLTIMTEPQSSYWAIFRLLSWTSGGSFTWHYIRNKWKHEVILTVMATLKKSISFRHSL